MNSPEESYRQLIENIPDAIVFLFDEDPDLRYTFVGGEGLERVGLTKEGLEGQPVADGRPPHIRDKVQSHYRQALAGEEAVFELEAEGRCFRFQVNPVRDADGNVRCGAGIAQDITERKVYEQELEQTNQQLEQFSELLTHDLKNPLNVLTGHVDLLKDEYESDHIEPIEDALARIESLAEQNPRLLTENAVESVEPIRLDEIAETAWRNVATKDAVLQTTAECVVTANRSDLQRLFENLFRNAIEHGGSAVTVRVSETVDGFAVEDTGPGIPEAEREAIFSRGYSGAESGTGLGLFIVQSVVEGHGWTITVTDSDEGGARFEICVDVDR